MQNKWCSLCLQDDSEQELLNIFSIVGLSDRIAEEYDIQLIQDGSPYNICLPCLQETINFQKQRKLYEKEKERVLKNQLLVGLQTVCDAQTQPGSVPGNTGDTVNLQSTEGSKIRSQKPKAARSKDTSKSPKTVSNNDNTSVSDGKTKGGIKIKFDWTNMSNAKSTNTSGKSNSNKNHQSENSDNTPSPTASMQQNLVLGVKENNRIAKTSGKSNSNQNVQSDSNETPSSTTERVSTPSSSQKQPVEGKKRVRFSIQEDTNVECSEPPQKKGKFTKSVTSVTKKKQTQDCDKSALVNVPQIQSVQSKKSTAKPAATKRSKEDNGSGTTIAASATTGIVVAVPSPAASATPSPAPASLLTSANSGENVASEAGRNDNVGTSKKNTGKDHLNRNQEKTVTNKKVLEEKVAAKPSVGAAQLVAKDASGTKPMNTTLPDSNNQVTMKAISTKSTSPPQQEVSRMPASVNSQAANSTVVTVDALSKGSSPSFSSVTPVSVAHSNVLSSNGTVSNGSEKINLVDNTSTTSSPNTQTTYSEANGQITITYHNVGSDSNNKNPATTVPTSSTVMTVSEGRSIASTTAATKSCVTLASSISNPSTVSISPGHTVASPALLQPVTIISIPAVASTVTAVTSDVCQPTLCNTLAPLQQELTTPLATAVSTELSSSGIQKRRHSTFIRVSTNLFDEPTAQFASIHKNLLIRNVESTASTPRISPFLVHAVPDNSNNLSASEQTAPSAAVVYNSPSEYRAPAGGYLHASAQSNSMRPGIVGNNEHQVLGNSVTQNMPQIPMRIVYKPIGDGTTQCQNQPVSQTQIVRPQVVVNDPRMSAVHPRSTNVEPSTSTARGVSVTVSGQNLPPRIINSALESTSGQGPRFLWNDALNRINAPQPGTSGGTVSFSNAHATVSSAAPMVVNDANRSLSNTDSNSEQTTSSLTPKPVLMCQLCTEFFLTRQAIAAHLNQVHYVECTPSLYSTIYDNSIWKLLVTRARRKSIATTDDFRISRKS